MKRLAISLLALAAVSSGATAADLFFEPAPLAYQPEPIHNWGGFYAGSFVGYGAGTASADSDPPGSPDRVPLAGWLAGVNLGHNWQEGSFVSGIEADAAWAGLSGSTPCSNPTFTCGGSVNWLATLRGRVGVAADSVLIYATGGIAAAGGEGTVSPAVGFSGSDARTFFGYAVGAGAELAISDSLSVRAEYNYMEFATATAPAGTLNTVPTTISPHLHTVKLGANFSF